MANIAAEIRAKSKLDEQAIAEGKPEQILAQFGEDCVLTGPGNSVFKGKDGIKKHLEALQTSGVSSVKLIEDSYEVGPLGDGFAFHNGNWDAFDKAGNRLCTIKNQEVVEQGLATGNIEQIVAQYTEDCVFMGRGSSVFKGKEGIKKYIEELQADGVRSVKLIEDTYEAGALGDGIAFHSGQWDVCDKDGNKLFTLKSLAIWKKVGGDWKVYRESTEQF